jgi:uncharacterized membrane protein
LLENEENSDKKLEIITKQIYDVIEHYKSPNPVGLPINIPDPILIPDMQQNINIGKLFMKNVTANGVSKFIIQNVFLEIDKKIKATCTLVFEKLVLKGNYSLSSFLARSNGLFVIISPISFKYFLFFLKDHL